jgi:hypothetical protein
MTNSSFKATKVSQSMYEVNHVTRFIPAILTPQQICSHRLISSFLVYLTLCFMYCRNVMMKWVQILFCIREVTSANLGQRPVKQQTDATRASQIRPKLLNYSPLILSLDVT